MGRCYADLEISSKVGPIFACRQTLVLPRYVVWAVIRAFGKAGATPAQVARCLGDAGLVTRREADSFVLRMLRKLRPIRGRRRIIRLQANGRYVATLKDQ